MSRSRSKAQIQKQYVISMCVVITGSGTSALLSSSPASTVAADPSRSQRGSSAARWSPARWPARTRRPGSCFGAGRVQAGAAGRHHLIAAVQADGTRPHRARADGATLTAGRPATAAAPTARCSGDPAARWPAKGRRGSVAGVGPVSGVGPVAGTGGVPGWAGRRGGDP